MPDQAPASRRSAKAQMPTWGKATCGSPGLPFLQERIKEPIPPALPGGLGRGQQLPRRWQTHGILVALHKLLDLLLALGRENRAGDIKQMTTWSQHGPQRRANLGLQLCCGGYIIRPTQPAYIRMPPDHAR